MQKPTVVTTFLALFLSGCGGNPYLVAPNAVSSMAPGAPGYLVVGSAQSREYPRVRNIATTELLTVQFVDAAGKSVPASRSSCLGYEPKPCRPLDIMDLQVLQVPPGRYQLSRLESRVHTQNIYSPVERVQTLSLSMSSTGLNVRSGEISYVGDFLVDFDFGTKRVRVMRYDFDRAKLQELLARYPGLTGARSVDALRFTAIPAKE